MTLQSGIADDWYDSLFICGNGVKFMLLVLKWFCKFFFFWSYDVNTSACTTAEGVLNSFKTVYVCLQIYLVFVSTLTV